MGFSRQEYWSGFPCPPPGDLPDPEIEPRSPTLQVDSLPSEPPGEPWKATVSITFKGDAQMALHLGRGTGMEEGVRERGM